MNIMQTTQSLVGLYGIRDSEFNIVALAAKTYDSNRKRCDMYDSSMVCVPNPVKNHQSLDNTSYGAFGYANQRVANPGNKKAHHTSEQAVTGNDKEKNVSVRGARSSYRGRSNRGMHGYGRGGNRFTFTNSKPSNNYSCHNCGVPGDHIKKNCPLALAADAADCSKCKCIHSPTVPCPSTPPVATTNAVKSTNQTHTASSSSFSDDALPSPNKLIRNSNKARIGISKGTSRSVRTIRFSQLKDMDEVNDNNIENLPSEEITFDFEIYSPDVINKIRKYNKNTFFIKDQPKNFKEECNDSFAKFKQAEKEIKKLEKIIYPCESVKCNIHKNKVVAQDSSQIVSRVLSCIKQEFPEAVDANEHDFSQPITFKYKTRRNNQNNVHSTPNQVSNNIASPSISFNKSNHNNISQYGVSGHSMTQGGVSGSLLQKISLKNVASNNSLNGGSIYIYFLLYIICNFYEVIRQLL